MERSKAFWTAFAEQVGLVVACAGTLPFAHLSTARRPSDDLQVNIPQLSESSELSLRADMSKIAGDLRRTISVTKS